VFVNRFYELICKPSECFSKRLGAIVHDVFCFVLLVIKHVWGG